MKKKYIIWVFVIICVIIAFVLGDIEIQTSIFSSQSTTKNITKQLENIQNITGVFFRSPGESLEKELTDFSSTQKTLDLRTYEFTHKDFKNTIKNLAENNVNIRIIIEDNKYQQFQNTLKVLGQDFSWYQNIQLKSDKQMGTEYTHAKVNLIDSGFIIQTANLTNSSFVSNREHFFQSYDSGVWKSLYTIFEKDRNGEKITIKDIHPNLIVCNINCRGVIEQLLSSAEESIIIQTQYITDESIRNILREKKSLPEFKMLVADTKDNTNLVRIFWDDHARKFTQYYNHTKMILIDHKILLLGSMNLSSNSLDNNREIWILLLDTAIIDEFTTQFYTDRE